MGGKFAFSLRSYQSIGSRVTAGEVIRVSFAERPIVIGTQLWSSWPGNLIGIHSGSWWKKKSELRAGRENQFHPSLFIKVPHNPSVNLTYTHKISPINLAVKSSVWSCQFDFLFFGSFQLTLIGVKMIFVTFRKNAGLEPLNIRSNQISLAMRFYSYERLTQFPPNSWKQRRNTGNNCALMFFCFCFDLGISSGASRRKTPALLTTHWCCCVYSWGNKVYESRVVELIVDLIARAQLHL